MPQATFPPVTEPARTTPVRAKVDVLVCGAGLAGTSAAVAAARAGAKVIVCERNSYAGGVATAGMCCSVFNCLYTPSHELVVRGNSAEFLDRLAGAEGYGARWHDHKGHIIFDVERAKRVLTDLLQQAGVTTLWQTPVCAAVMERERLCGCIVESKSGREAILADAVVDCTGDADVAVLAGAPVHTLQEIPGAWHSLCFRMGNVDVNTFVEYFVHNPSQFPEYMDVDWTLEEALEQYRQTGTFLFPHGGGMQMDLILRGVESGEYPVNVGVYKECHALQMHAIRDTGTVNVVTGGVHLEALDVEAISRAMDDGRRMAALVCDYFRTHIPGFDRAFVANTADNLGIRVSRWIDGEMVFTPEMKRTPVRFDDVIGRGVVEEDYVKHKGKGAWGVQTFRDETFDIPYRCMLPKQVEGLVMGAGRSLSAKNPYLLRVMALTMVTGQAAGVAAALSAATHTVPRAVDIQRVQTELIRQGVVLGK